MRQSLEVSKGQASSRTWSSVTQRTGQAPNGGASRCGAHRRGMGASPVQLRATYPRSDHRTADQ